MFDLNDSGCRHPGSPLHPVHKKWKAKPEQIDKAFEAMRKIDEAFGELLKLGLTVEYAPAGVAVTKGPLEGDRDEYYGNLVGLVQFHY